MEKTELSFHIARIIHLYITGETNKKEKKILEKWLAEDPHHTELLNGFCNREHLDEKILLHDMFEPAEGLNRFMQEKRRLDRRKMIRKWRSVAAVFIGICGITLALFFGHFPYLPENTSGKTVADILPAQPKATLILEDGREVLLSDSLKEAVKQTAAKVSINQGQLNYEPENNIVLAYNELVIPRGGEFRLQLSDGTRVWLNAGSRLKYPVAFTGTQRDVWLEGEAYFEVAKDHNKPFIVKTGQMDIRVLGTSFNVEAYPEETTQATLVEGLVNVRSGNKEQLLKPGEQAVCRDGKLILRQVDVQPYIAWKDRRFVFNDDKLEEIIRKLERWYDIDFLIRDNSVRELTFTGNLPKYENLGQILHKLQLATHIHFVQQGRVIIIEAD